MKVYGYFYNPCNYESASGLVSLHMTEEGAIQAMQEAKKERYLDWVEHNKWCSENGYPELVEEIYKEPEYQLHQVMGVEVQE